MKQIKSIGFLIGKLVFAQSSVYCVAAHNPEQLERYDQKNRFWRTCISKVHSLVRPSFNFNHIVDVARPDDLLTNGVLIERNASGQITRIVDGKSPIALGSFPSKQEDIEKLRKEFNLTADDVIHIHSLLYHHENSWFGLHDLVKKNPNSLRISYYPTVDYGPPSLAALASLVNALEHRPDSDKLTYVHCKAGKGRSAVSIASYLAHLCAKSGNPAVQNQVYTFLREKRDKVNFKEHHWNGFNQFCSERNTVNNIEQLCTKYPYHGK